MKCHRSSKIRNQYQKINTLSFKYKHVLKQLILKLLGRLFFLTWHKFAVAAAKIYRKQKINIKSAKETSYCLFKTLILKCKIDREKKITWEDLFNKSS